MSRPIFECYPRLRETIPWKSIASLPTPVTRLALGPYGRIWVKRDDLSGHLYGGNKVRKLEFLLALALAEKRHTVLTFGAAGSNHVLATARYCEQLGLACIAIISRQPQTENLARNLAATIRAGAVLRSCPRYSQIARMALAEARHCQRERGRYPLLVPPGGSSATGALGFVNAGFELAAQIKEGLLPEPDRIYVALGTTGTVIGLAIGIAAAGLNSRLVAVRVVDPRIAAEEKRTKLWKKSMALLRRGDPDFPELEPGETSLEIREEFFGSGYAISTPETEQAIKISARAGLRLENTYTGKTMAALISDLRGRHKKSNVLFWNTVNARPLAPASGVKTDTVAAELSAYL